MTGNKSYRKHLSGESAFYSFIPVPLSGVAVEHTPAMDRLIAETAEAIHAMNARTARITGQERTEGMRREAKASCELALGKPNVFAAFTLSDGRDSDALQTDTDNLIAATDYALGARTALPLSGRLLKNAHYLACRSERYEKKYPGEFRTSPVWIGRKGCGLRDALFVPPVDEDMTGAFSDLEKYINYADDEHVLVRAALIHYQFEMIHPFIDANGRMGRLLNTLFLMEQNVISEPVLPLSEMLGRRVVRYYMELQNVSMTGCYDDWIMFFLSVVRDAAAAYPLSDSAGWSCGGWQV